MEKLVSGKFHSDWINYFAHNYTRITISQLNQESNCTLCGHPIYKEVGLLERTGSKVVNYKGIDFSIPDKIEVGCDCYGYNIKPVLNIIEKLRSFFPNLKVELDEDKIEINKLIISLINYSLKNASNKWFNTCRNWQFANKVSDELSKTEAEIDNLQTKLM